MKVVKYVVFFLYLLLVLIITACLLTYNEFGYSEFKDKTLIIAKELNGFKEGSLLIANKKLDNVNEENNILYYDTYGSNTGIEVNKIVTKTVTNESEITYYLDNNRYLSSSYLISNVDDVVEIPILGYIFLVFTSALGYLLFIVLPILFAFIYEIYAIVKASKK